MIPSMKTNTTLTIRLALALFTSLAALCLITAPAARAHAGEHDDKGKVAIPATVPAIWTEINKHQTELTQVVQTKKLAEVHHHAYAIRDLVAALPAKAAADKKARVEGASKNMASLADKLDAAGDNNKQADAEAGLKQLDALLKQLKAQFPEAGA